MTDADAPYSPGLDRLLQDLYSRTWLIGRVRRRRAARALAQLLPQYHAPVAEVFAEALDRNTDSVVQAVAANCLNTLNDTDDIDVVCAVWAKTRGNALGELIARKRWVASAPPSVRVISALHAGYASALVEGEAPIAEALLKVVRDEDGAIRQAARSALLHLAKQTAKDFVARYALLENDKTAWDIAIQARYVPTEAG